MWQEWSRCSSQGRNEGTYLTKHHRMNGTRFRMISSNMDRNLRSITVIVPTKRAKVEAFLLRFLQPMEINVLACIQQLPCFVRAFRAFVEQHGASTTRLILWHLRRSGPLLVAFVSFSYRLKLRAEMLVPIIDAMWPKCTISAVDGSLRFHHRCVGRQRDDKRSFWHGCWSPVAVRPKTINNGLIDIWFVFDSFPYRSLQLLPFHRKKLYEAIQDFLRKDIAIRSFIVIVSAFGFVGRHFVVHVWICCEQSMWQFVR